MTIVLLADGCEEIEALTVVDVLRRAGQQVVTASIGGKQVTGSHGITIQADVLLGDVQQQAYDLVVLPGGMPGTDRLQADQRVADLVLDHVQRGAYVAAICAAPKVLGALGVLSGKRATCYPSFEDQLIGATVDPTSPVVVDGAVVTSRGMGTALEFALVLTQLLCGRQTADELADSVQYKRL